MKWEVLVVLDDAGQTIRLASTTIQAPVGSRIVEAVRASWKGVAVLKSVVADKLV